VNGNGVGLFGRFVNIPERFLFSGLGGVFGNIF